MKKFSLKYIYVPCKILNYLILAAVLCNSVLQKEGLAHFPLETQEKKLFLNAANRTNIFTRRQRAAISRVPLKNRSSVIFSGFLFSN